MRRHIALLVVAATLGLAACQTTTTYKPEYVKASVVPAAEQIDGKALVYLPEPDASYVFNEGATTFTGSGAKMSVPLGLMTREIGKTVYGAAFRGGAEVATVAASDGQYRATIQPRVSDFKYYFHQLENLGFAITPGAELSLTVNLLDASGATLQTKTYASGERKGGSYMMSMSPEEKISRLTHEIIGELMQQSLADLRTWLATPAQ